ncbi:MAG: molybdenum cofactor biosynthesis protein B, partial [Nitrospiria bacterium]
MFSVGVLTVSDKGAIGEREDASGLLLHQLVDALPGKVIAYEIVPDEAEAIRNKLISFCDRWQVDLILTTGGTGISPRDVTPDVTGEVIDHLVPGM